MVNDAAYPGNSGSRQNASLPAAERKPYDVFLEILHNAKVREGIEEPQPWLLVAQKDGSGKIGVDLSKALSLYNFAVQHAMSLGIVAYNEQKEDFTYNRQGVEQLIREKKIYYGQFTATEIDVLLSKISGLEKKVLQPTLVPA